MKLSYIITVLSTVCLISCNDRLANPGRVVGTYYLYMNGDSSSKAKIKYLQRVAGIDATDNEVISEEVVLPYKKAINYVDKATNSVSPGCFLELCETESSRIRLFIVDPYLRTPDTICTISTLFFADSIPQDCLKSHSIGKDSILNYLKQQNYPCYMEFNKGDACKRVRMHDWWYK